MFESIYTIYKIGKKIPFIISIISHLYLMNSYRSDNNLKRLKRIRNLTNQ